MADLLLESNLARLNGEWFYVSETALRHIEKQNIQGQWIEDVLKTCKQYPCGVSTRYGYHVIVPAGLQFEAEGKRFRLKIHVAWSEEDWPVLHSIYVLPPERK